MAVKDGDTVVGSYLLGRDFTKNSEGVYELKAPIKVTDSKKIYTVEETLYTAEGFTVSVSYKVDGEARPGSLSPVTSTSPRRSRVM